jgi:hypothetical protein
VLLPHPLPFAFLLQAEIYTLFDVRTLASNL